MLLVRSEEHRDRWCAFHELPHGDMMSLEQCWLLAHTWYADKLRPDWHRKMLEEVEGMLAAFGMTEPFWNLRVVKE
jgi:hypothetical protein